MPETENSENRINPPQAPIKFREYASYFAVNLGNIPIMTLIGSFLLIFYTDVVGLDPAAVGTMFLISRIFDGVNDPMMGYIIDHLPRSKWGRFKPYIFLGSIICGINFLLLWLGPSLAPSYKIVVAYITYFCLGISFDIMDVPLNSLIPVMVTGQKKRTTLSIIKSIGYGLGGILFTLPIVSFIQSFPTAREGYHALIIIAVIFIITLSCLGTLGIKERVKPVSTKKYSIKDYFKIFSLQPVIGLALTALIGGIALNVASTTALYYFTYVTGDANFFTFFTLATLIMGAAGIIPALFLARKMGNKQVWMYGMTIGLIPSTLALFIPSSQPILLIIFIGLGRLGTGFASIVNYALQADLMDYVDWKRGHRAEGAIAAIFSFITKAGGGIGSAIPGFILAATGYVPNQSQDLPAITGIIFLFLWIPVIATIASLLCMGFLYTINQKRAKRIQDELTSRR